MTLTIKKKGKSKKKRRKIPTVPYYNISSLNTEENLNKNNKRPILHTILNVYEVFLSYLTKGVYIIYHLLYVNYKVL
jgi:hypothetical protein